MMSSSALFQGYTGAEVAYWQASPLERRDRLEPVPVFDLNRLADKPASNIGIGRIVTGVKHDIVKTTVFRLVRTRRNVAIAGPSTDYEAFAWSALILAWRRRFRMASKACFNCPSSDPSSQGSPANARAPAYIATRCFSGEWPL